LPFVTVSPRVLIGDFACLRRAHKSLRHTTTIRGLSIDTVWLGGQIDGVLSKRLCYSLLHVCFNRITFKSRNCIISTGCVPIWVFKLQLHVNDRNRKLDRPIGYGPSYGQSRYTRLYL